MDCLLESWPCGAWKRSDSKKFKGKSVPHWQKHGEEDQILGIESNDDQPSLLPSAELFHRYVFDMKLNWSLIGEEFIQIPFNYFLFVSGNKIDHHVNISGSESESFFLVQGLKLFFWNFAASVGVNHIEHMIEVFFLF